MFFKTKGPDDGRNISGGIAAILVSMEGMGLPAGAPRETVATWLFWAGFGILVAYFFDCFDGVVARALKQVNQFGAEFDNVADLVAYSVAPSFLLYFAFRRYILLPGPGESLDDPGGWPWRWRWRSCRRSSGASASPASTCGG